VTRQELLLAVEDRIGRTVPPHVLTYCRRKGILTTNKAKRGGWCDYPEQAVAQLTGYMKTRSRLLLASKKQ